jgi:hypothetical protein
MGRIMWGLAPSPLMVPITLAQAPLLLTVQIMSALEPSPLTARIT